MRISDVERDVLQDALDRMELGDDRRQRALTPLVGGVSSSIVRVDSGSSVFCIKRALPQLRVAAVWHAPVERNQAEVAWIRLVSSIQNNWVPQVLGQDPLTQSFAMQYLPEDRYPVWKSLLRDGQSDIRTADAVGSRLGHIHAATANQSAISEAFANQDQFYALRLEPYFVASAHKHPSLASTLIALVSRTYDMRRALVHGDVSPKNILVGPDGPVFLDAECAVYGDPAFDLAFVLNHLLLKSVWRPQHRKHFFRSFECLIKSHAAHVCWEPLEALHSRTAELLAALLLARIDGKSPVEYLTDPQDQDRVRRFAVSHLITPSASPSDLLSQWSYSVCPTS
jgi:aminoglycoside phosphotransferase (APT) family kinase protein